MPTPTSATLPASTPATSDTKGGLRGYGGSFLAGEWRSVGRLEERWVRPSPVRNVDVGFAGFADAGTLWAGRAPFGQNVPFRGSMGVSVLAAYPAGSRRLLRLDLAVPSGRDGNRRLEARFRIVRTERFWQEPAEVTRARTGPVPSTLFSWPVP